MEPVWEVASGRKVFEAEEIDGQQPASLAAVASACVWVKALETCLLCEEGIFFDLAAHCRSRSCRDVQQSNHRKRCQIE